MIAKSYCALFALVLAGCAAVAPDPIVVKEAKEVDVPIGVPCKADKPAVPTWALTGVSPDADIYEKARAAVAELGQRITYESLLLAAVDACQ